MSIDHVSPHAAPHLALLADRDRDSLDMYAEYLRNADCDVEEAEDGREALAKARSRHPQIIITETHLLAIDGFELCELLRSDDSTRAIPIIVVTADVHPADIARAERAGADVVLAKPCLPDCLLAEVRHCLETSAQLRDRATAARARAHEQLLRSTHQIERSIAIRRRASLSRAFRRLTTMAPRAAPPALRCPICDARLVYESSHIGGISQRQQEQWDYYECPGKCGTFQYREGTRKLSRIL